MRLLLNSDGMPTGADVFVQKNYRLRVGQEIIKDFSMSKLRKMTHLMTFLLLLRNKNAESD
jgi:hypothetical protein